MSGPRSNLLLPRSPGVAPCVFDQCRQEACDSYPRPPSLGRPVGREPWLPADPARGHATGRGCCCAHSLSPSSAPPECRAPQSQPAQVLRACGERQGRGVDGGRAGVSEAQAAKDDRVRGAKAVGEGLLSGGPRSPGSHLFISRGAGQEGQGAWGRAGAGEPQRSSGARCCHISCQLHSNCASASPQLCDLRPGP